MKKVLLLLIILPNLLFSQSNEENDNTEQKAEQTFFYKPQFYIYANHHNNSGNNFLADGHEADFVGVGIQINFVKFHEDDISSSIANQVMVKKEKEGEAHIIKKDFVICCEVKVYISLL